MAGYNNIRFDDEVTRHSLYRNFFDPYAREWKSNNTRWDLLDIVRVTRALRPEGINWPDHETGLPSFKLEHLTQANKIKHESAHDALSDVIATIEVAKLIKQNQPRLYDYCFQNRKKQNLSKLLNPIKPIPLVHTSGMFSSEIIHTTVIYPLIQHPVNKNAIVCVDLRHNPEVLNNLDADEIYQRLYTRRETLEAEGKDFIPLKAVHLNKCPVLAPTNTLTESAYEQIQLNPDLVQQHLHQIEQYDLTSKLVNVFEQQQELDPLPADANLYGGFFGYEDQSSIEQIRQTAPENLNSIQPVFRDHRLDTLFFLYKARNYPEILTDQEKENWKTHRMERLIEYRGEHLLTFESFGNKLEELKETYKKDHDKLTILSQLENYLLELKF